MIDISLPPLFNFEETLSRKRKTQLSNQTNRISSGRCTNCTGVVCCTHVVLEPFYRWLSLWLDNVGALRPNICLLSAPLPIHQRSGHPTQKKTLGSVGAGWGWGDGVVGVEGYQYNTTGETRTGRLLAWLAGTLWLFLQEPHLVAAAVRFDWHVVAAAEVLLALIGGGLPQGARQAQCLSPVLRLPGEASKLTGNRK